MEVESNTDHLNPHRSDIVSKKVLSLDDEVETASGGGSGTDSDTLSEIKDPGVNEIIKGHVILRTKTEDFEVNKDMLHSMSSYWQNILDIEEHAIYEIEENPKVVKSILLYFYRKENEIIVNYSLYRNIIILSHKWNIDGVTKFFLKKSINLLNVDCCNKCNTNKKCDRNINIIKNMKEVWHIVKNMKYVSKFNTQFLKLQNKKKLIQYVHSDVFIFLYTLIEKDMEHILEKFEEFEDDRHFKFEEHRTLITGYNETYFD